MSKIWPHNIVDSGQFDSHKNDFTLQIPYGGTTTNVGNAYEIATPVIPALTEGMAVCVKINTDSTGAATLNWAGTGDKNIVTPDGGAVINLKKDGIYTFRYDGVSYILQNIALDLSAHLADNAKHNNNGQLTFPATPNPSSDPNTLDDYEEGAMGSITFTCGTSGTITVSSASGVYTKIGRLVHFRAYVPISSVSSPVGILTMNGLPFVVGAPASAISIAITSSMETTATTSLQGFANDGTSTVIISKFAAGAISNLAADIKAGLNFIISGTYSV